jgi:hypothetical protein
LEVPIIISSYPDKMPPQNRRNPSLEGSLWQLETVLASHTPEIEAVALSAKILYEALLIDYRRLLVGHQLKAASRQRAASIIPLTKLIGSAQKSFAQNQYHPTKLAQDLIAISKGYQAQKDNLEHDPLYANKQTPIANCKKPDPLSLNPCKEQQSSIRILEAPPGILANLESLEAPIPQVLEVMSKVFKGVPNHAIIGSLNVAILTGK